MRLLTKIAITIATAISVPAITQAATLGGVDYATQYDYREFYAATDHKPFTVVLLGNPFDNGDMASVASRLLPKLQAAKPPPNLTFTYDAPAERPHPYYRLVLVFNPANDLGADPVCQGVKRFKPAKPGEIYVFAVYCRNDQALSQVTARVSATSIDDPAVGQMVRELMPVVFDRSPSLLPQTGGMNIH